MVLIKVWRGVLGRELHSRKKVVCCVYVCARGGGVYHTIRFYDYPVRTNTTHRRKKKGNKNFLATVNLGKKKEILCGKTKLYYYDVIMN
jgi:hypothetical protein